MSVTVRPARREDCARCAELSRIPELVAIDGTYVGEPFFRRYVDDDGLFLVAEEGNEVKGYILVEPCKGKIAYVQFLAVDPTARGNGIGARLLDTAKRRCAELGLTYLYLHAPEKNPRTVAFYRKQGMTGSGSYTAFGTVVTKEKPF